MLNKFVVILWLLHAVSSMTTDSTRDSNFYYGAIMKYFYYDLEISENVTMGSVTDTDEVGKYGFHSPVKAVSGLIVLAVDLNGRKDGCHHVFEQQNEKWIALIKRGNCTFTNKIENAMKSNASAVIIYNNKDTDDLTLMSHEGASTIPAIMTSFALGKEVNEAVTQGQKVYVDIRPGDRHRQEMTNLLERASIVFVSISFMILMVISLAWLVFYYIQRFRLIQSQHRGQQLQFVATKKAIAKIPVKTLKNDDKEVAQEQTCIVCLDRYKLSDVLRVLECNHTFHRKCIDPWLQNKQTCPMCKFDIVKGQAAASSTTALSTLENEPEQTVENEYEVINEVETPSDGPRNSINVVIVTSLEQDEEENQAHPSCVHSV